MHEKTLNYRHAREDAMKKPGVFTIALAAIFYATSLSLHWPSDEMPSLSVDGVNAQNRVGVNTRLTRPPIDRTVPWHSGNPYVNRPYRNPYVNPFVNRR
jgi:hypothetical protein